MENINFDSLQTLKTKKGIAEKDYMKHLPKPLKPQELIWVHPNQDDIDAERFMRIIHSDKESVSVFIKTYFE